MQGESGRPVSTTFWRHHIEPRTPRCRLVVASRPRPEEGRRGAVLRAQRQGLRPGRNFGRYGDFELGIDAKDNVIYHLVYRPSR